MLLFFFQGIPAILQFQFFGDLTWHREMACGKHRQLGPGTLGSTLDTPAHPNSTQPWTMMATQ